MTSPNAAQIALAEVSAAPPAEKGTMTRILLFGQAFWAKAFAPTNGAAMAPRPAFRIDLRLNKFRRAKSLRIFFTIVSRLNDGDLTSPV